MDDLLADFLAETRETLGALGGELVAWEDEPGDRARLDVIFRFFHTVKGNCGFFDFPRLEALSHAAEDALSDVRAGRRTADSGLVGAVLAILDRIGDMIDSIESGSGLPKGRDDLLIAALDAGPGMATASALQHSTASEEEQRTATLAQRSIRLPVELLDRVMSGVSDMVLARNELGRRLRETSAAASVEEPFERLSSIIADVRDAITRTRMQRVDGLFATLPRLVRDLSAELGKQLTVDIDGNEVELDREMIEIIRDPLTHIIRNAIDHGIEAPAVRAAMGKPEHGRLVISARQSCNQILIDVADDGRGIDDARLVEKGVAAGLVGATQATRLSQRERIALIFEPGLSTAEAVTSISGRGVGMDVVRANVERIGGTVEVESTLGQGTRFTLRVPLTLTIIPALTVSIGEQRFAIPRSSIEEIVRVREGTLEISRVGGAVLASIRGPRLPCLILADLLRLESPVSEAERPLVVLRLSGGQLFTLAVDRLHGHEELVVKPVAPAIIATGLYAGTTLTDDGNPILLLEVAGLAKAGGLQFEAAEREARPADPQETAEAARMTSVLLFEGLDGRRKAMPMAAVARIEEVGRKAVERDGDRVLVVLDGRILPLAGTGADPLPETLRLFRLSDGSSEMGYAIHEAVGIRQVQVELAARDDAPETEGVALIDGEPTSLMAPYKLFALHAVSPADERPRLCHLPSGDAWIQNFVRPMVEAAGYRVADADEADIDVAITARVEDAVCTSARQVIRLRSNPGETPEEPDSIYRYDHAGLLSALRSCRRGNRL